MIEFMTADELSEKTKKGNITTIYGMADAGKTSFMVTVAEKLKTLYIDTEGKFGKVCDNVKGYNKFKNNLFGYQVRSLKELIDIVSSKDINQFDAIIIDSITNLVDKEMHYIAFVQKRRTEFDDYKGLGVNFMASIEILQEKGISVFFTMQAKNDGGYYTPDAQGGLIPKKAIEASDWMFFIHNGEKGRTLHLKNNFDCALKTKGIPEDYDDSLTKDVRFSSLWEIFPSKPKKVTKKEISNLKSKLKELGEKRGTPVDENKFLSAIGADSIELIRPNTLKKAFEILDKKLSK